MVHCPVHCKIFSRCRLCPLKPGTPTYLLPSVLTTVMSLKITNIPWEAKSPPVENHCSRLCDFSQAYFYYNYAAKIQFCQVILTTKDFSLSTTDFWGFGGRHPVQVAEVKGGYHENRVLLQCKED